MRHASPDGITAVRTSNPDTLIGTNQEDEFSGRGEDDYLRGRGAADTLKGGSDDDIVVGNTGNDRIEADDGSRDHVDCGLGEADRAFVDPKDRVEADCEIVNGEPVD